MKIVVKPEFKELIPRLKPEEYAQLESSIKQEGCRDSLVLWGEILIDGHNRYEICEKHGIEYKTVQKDFTNEKDAICWIIRNQFGRRNLSLYERSLLALKLEEALKPVFQEKAKENQRVAGGDRKSESSKSLLQKKEKAIPIHTHKEVAKVAQVSHDTISKVKTIQEKASPIQKEKLYSGEESINHIYQEIIYRNLNKRSFI